MLLTAVLVACALNAASTIDLGDADLDVPALVAKSGYPVEEHEVTTPDGYKLRMQRIPHGRDNNTDPSVKRTVVFLMHGLFSSSADYITPGPGVALGYYLAEQGFDVWLGNARGNYYSRGHVFLNPSLPAFWDFSWDEIGHVDLCTMIDFTLNKTDSAAIHYVGHSQGTTSFLVMTSLKPEYNAKIRTAHLMAPVAYFNHLNQPLLSLITQLVDVLDPFAESLIHNIFNKLCYQYVSEPHLTCQDPKRHKCVCAHFEFAFAVENLRASKKYVVDLQQSSNAPLGNLLGLSELFPRGEVFEYVDGAVRCKVTYKLYSVCVPFLIGFNSIGNHYDPEMFPVIIGHAPAGAALKQLAHYGQNIKNKQFQRWDCPLAIQNRAAYGTSRAPDYNVSAVTARVILHYAQQDTLAPPLDVLALSNKLQNAELHLVPQANFTHIDYVWATNAIEMVYESIVQSMRAFDKI